MPKAIRAFDLFCGAGGSSCGARSAGIKVIGGIDAWSVATDTFALNFPSGRVWNARIETLSAKQIASEIGGIDLLLASPECTNHTFAKGKRCATESAELSRKTANHVIRFAKAFKPRWIAVENVVSMKRWEYYSEWKRRLARLEYRITEFICDAQDFGVPQSRRRLFVLFDRKQEPQVPIVNEQAPIPVEDVLEMREHTNGFNYKMSPVFDSHRRRAEGTLQRARRAIAAIGPKKPFLIVYYGSDRAGGWQELARPLRTITTLDRFALVKPSKNGHVMRMLQPPELAKAMGFPASYSWPDVSRRERIRLIGNAVAPPVMSEVLRALCGLEHSPRRTRSILD